MAVELPPVEPLLESMCTDIDQHIQQRQLENVHMLGIHTGGLWVAEALHARLGMSAPLGELDIAFYRDDFSRIGLHPKVRPSNLPFSVEDQHLLLVDDVLSTGRTVRAALNVLFDYGRPASVSLAVLVNRGDHELPIAADVTGTELSLPRGWHVKLSGPEPLQLELREA